MPRGQWARRIRTFRGERSIRRSGSATTVADPQRSLALLVDRYATALGLEDKETAARRVPADRVRALFRLDRLPECTPADVEYGDGPWTTHSHVKAAEVAVVHHDVGSPWQRQRRFDRGGVAIDHDERSGVGRAPERSAPLLRHDGQPMRAGSRDRDRAGLHQDVGFDDTDHRRLRDVQIDRAARVIAKGPAGSAGEVDRRRDPALVDRDHRGRAAGSHGFAQVEAEKTSRPSVVRERVWSRTDRNPTDERLVRTPKETHSSRRAVGREKQVLAAVDKDTGYAWQIRDASEIRRAAAVQAVDPTSAGMCDEDPAAARVNVRIGVIEPRFGAGRHGHEADVPQRHAALASTFFWQKA